MSVCRPSGLLVTPLAALNRLPLWLGTLVISPDGSVLQSAGELVNSKDMALRFAAICNRVGRLFSLDSENKTPQFKRLTLHYRTSTYIMTCVGDTIYVIKRKVENANPLVNIDVDTMSGNRTPQQLIDFSVL